MDIPDVFNRKRNFIMPMGIILILLFVQIQQFFAQTWRHPGPYGGSITAIEVFPENVDIIYLGVGSRGIFKSTDGGESWQHYDEGIPASDQYGQVHPVIKFIRCHPTDENVVFASIEHTNIPERSPLLKSSDGGESWNYSLTGLPVDCSICDLWFNPENPDILLLAGRQPSLELWRSEDCGESWTALDQFPRPDSEWEVFWIRLRGDGSNTGHVFALATDPEYMTELYESWDAGITWSTLFTYDRNILIDNFAVNQSDSDILLGINKYLFPAESLLRSIDGGYNWRYIQRPQGLTDGYLDYIEVDYKGNFYISNQVRLYKTNDSGDNFTVIYEDPMPYPFKVAANNFPMILIAPPPGLYISYDGGENFEARYRGLTARSANIPVAIGNSPGLIILYNYDSSYLYRTPEIQGDYWVTYEMDARVYWLESHPDYPDTLFRTGSGSGLMRSFDGGYSWETISEEGNFYEGMIQFNPQDPSIIYTVRNGRFEAWSDNGNVRMMTTEGNRFNNGCKFQIHPANPQHIYLFSGSWFLVSTDGGQSFVDICNTRRYNKFIDINPTNENILTALQLDNIDVIYRSIDQGATFIQTPAQPQLQARQFINSLKFRPQTNELYIGTDNGLWVSTDDCETIELFAGPYYRRVLGIDFTTDGNALHIGTAEDGVWTYIFHDNSVSNGWHRSKQPKTCTLPTIFPNPFNQTTTVHFNIFENSHIRIDIFNLNGQCVGRLLDAPYNSGEYSIPWNAQSLASGTYIFRIHLDEGNYYIKSKLLR